MRVTITLETGEHITGTIRTLIVDHDYSDAAIRVSPVEIDGDRHRLTQPMAGRILPVPFLVDFA